MQRIFENKPSPEGVRGEIKYHLFMKKVFFVSAIMCMAMTAFVACKKSSNVDSCSCWMEGYESVKVETPNPYDSCAALAEEMTNTSAGMGTYICE